MRKIDEAEDDFSQMRVEDFWAQRNTGQKILAGLGMAIGAAGSAITGGPNYAMQIVNNAIENDLARQKANIQLGRVRVENLRGALARTSQMYDNDLSSMEAARLASWRQVERDILMKRAGMRSMEMIQNTDILLAEARLKQKEYQTNLALSEASQVTQRFATQRIPGRPAVTVGEVEAAQLGLEDYDRKTYVKRGGGNARDPAEAKKLDDGYDAIDKTRGVIQSIRTLKKKYGSVEVINQKARGRMNGLVQQLNLQQAVMFGLGAISKEDKELTEGVSGGNPLEVMNFAVENIEDLDQSLGRSEKILQSRLNPVKPETVPRPFRRLQRHPHAEVFQSGQAVSAAREEFQPGI
jgi:hypothetical protein